MKKKWLTVILLFISMVSLSQITQEEAKLYELIMEYRIEKGLPRIPLSPSLMFVAQTHVRDLVDNTPDLGDCNGHSWSDKGDWTPCCYTPDHAQAQCMWDKPRELTSYTGNGYEIAIGSNDIISGYVATADSALKGWKGSPLHNAVILNEGIWNIVEWKAIGIGIYKGFVCAWFGSEPDE